MLTTAAVVSSATGAYALATPRSFYDSVVGVDLLGSYNQHLLSDIGAFYLGFGVLFAWAAASLSRQLVWAVCAAWSLTQLLHFSYHALHLEGFSPSAAIAQTVGLAAMLALPLAAGILLLRSPPGRRR